MRAVSLDRDVLLVTSALLRVNCVIVRGAVAAEESEAEDPAANPVRVIAPGAEAEAFVIDSPVLPDELEALPALLEQARFPAPVGLLATHADWDHLLGRLAFPGLALGCAESSAHRLAQAPGEAQRALRDFDEDLGIDRRRPLALGAVQPLSVPGRLEIGGQELELHTARGHTTDGMAIVIPWAGVLVAGDYLSPLEIPQLNAGDLIEEYLETLERLRGLLGRVEQVVPGHGPCMRSEQAIAICEQDIAYLQELRERGTDARLPQERRSRSQRALHEQNLAQLGLGD